jgi:hypothetical protein
MSKDRADLEAYRDGLPERMKDNCATCQRFNDLWVSLWRDPTSWSAFADLADLTAHLADHGPDCPRGDQQ